MVLVCWWGSSGSGSSCDSLCVGWLGLCVVGSCFMCVWCVGGVLIFLVVFSVFMVFLLVLVRAFMCPRRCMIYYKVRGPHD